jgi:hypothetical protein
MIREIAQVRTVCTHRVDLRLPISQCIVAQFDGAADAQQSARSLQRVDGVVLDLHPTLYPGQPTQPPQSQRRGVVGLDQQASVDPDQPAKAGNGAQAVVSSDAQIASQPVEDNEPVEVSRAVAFDHDTAVHPPQSREGILHEQGGVVEQCEVPGYVLQSVEGRSP